MLWGVTHVFAVVAGFSVALSAPGARARAAGERRAKALRGGAAGAPRTPPHAVPVRGQRVSAWPGTSHSCSRALLMLEIWSCRVK